MNSAKPPPPPPHRPGTSRPPPPPPLRTSKPPAVPSASPGTSQGHATAHATAIDAHAQAASHEPAHARGAAHEATQAPGSSVAPAPHVNSVAPAPHPSAVAPAPHAVVGVQPGQETRLRVSVKLSVRDPNLLLARPLAEGEAPPPGTRAAVLVLVEPAVEPESRSGGSST
jgi:hypothetical protein